MNKIVIVSIVVLVSLVILGSIAQGNRAMAAASGANTTKAAASGANTANAAASAAKGWCESQGKSGNWAFGCQNGWYDHDHCKSYLPESGDFAKGYKVGWDKGVCKK